MTISQESVTIGEYDVPELDFFNYRNVVNRCAGQIRFGRNAIIERSTG